MSKILRRRETKRNYYLKNKEKVKEIQREQYQVDVENTTSNKEKLNSLRRERYNLNTENRDKKVAYYLENKEILNQKKKERYFKTQNSRSDYIPRPSNHKPIKSWKSPELIRNFLESIKQELGISEYTDWYRVSRSLVDKFGGKKY
jgi:hypothetical protein